MPATTDSWKLNKNYLKRKDTQMKQLKRKNTANLRQMHQRTDDQDQVRS